jgi:hypothetical protein
MLKRKIGKVRLTTVGPHVGTIIDPNTLGEWNRKLWDGLMNDCQQKLGFSEETSREWVSRFMVIHLADEKASSSPCFEVE